MHSLHGIQWECARKSMIWPKPLSLFIHLCTLTQNDSHSSFSTLTFALFVNSWMLVDEPSLSGDWLHGLVLCLQVTRTTSRCVCGWWTPTPTTPRWCLSSRPVLWCWRRGDTSTAMAASTCHTYTCGNMWATILVFQVKSTIFKAAPSVCVSVCLYTWLFRCFTP